MPGTDVVPYDWRNACVHPSEIPMEDLMRIPPWPPFFAIFGVSSSTTRATFITEEWMKSYPIDVNRDIIVLGLRPLCTIHQILKWTPGEVHPLYWNDGSRTRGNRRAFVTIERIRPDE